MRAVLANSGLSNVVDAPLHFKLLRVSVPAGQSAASTVGDGFVFQISGVLAVVSESGRRILREGEAVFVGGGKSTTLRAEGGGPAAFLHFLLLRASDLDKAAEGAPATVTELYRTAAPIPGLKLGPYESFALSSVFSQDTPVMLPPGRARLATNPCSTASSTPPMTIGMVFVACLAAWTAGGPVVTMTSTLRRARLVARPTSRSAMPSAERYSSTMLWPST